MSNKKQIIRKRKVKETLEVKEEDVVEIFDKVSELGEEDEQ